jgi:hypothetical protein
MCVFFNSDFGEAVARNPPPPPSGYALGSSNSNNYINIPNNTLYLGIMLTGTLVYVTPGIKRAVLPNDSKTPQIIMTNVILIYVLLCVFQFWGKQLTLPPSIKYVELHSS